MRVFMYLSIFLSVHVCMFICVHVCVRARAHVDVGTRRTCPIRDNQAQDAGRITCACIALTYVTLTSATQTRIAVTW